MKKYFSHRFKRLLRYRTPDWRRGRWFGAYNKTKIRLKDWAGRVRGRARQIKNIGFKPPRQ